MSEELFLIAHKVRGEVAFDVAIQVQIGQELGWIIPTSGHRAYPFWNASMANFRILHPLGDGHNTNYPWDSLVPPMPEGLRDHYVASERSAPRPIEPTEDML